jgi:hypothetical protein
MLYLRLVGRFHFDPGVADVAKAALGISFETSLQQAANLGWGAGGQVGPIDVGAQDSS